MLRFIYMVHQYFVRGFQHSKSRENRMRGRWWTKVIQIFFSIFTSTLWWIAHIATTMLPCGFRLSSESLPKPWSCKAKNKFAWGERRSHRWDNGSVRTSHCGATYGTIPVPSTVQYIWQKNQSRDASKPPIAAIDFPLHSRHHTFQCNAE